ncbi:MAG: hypothetical protein ACR2J8_14665, partial [Thermomicrobiales bacterium]
LAADDPTAAMTTLALALRALPSDMDAQALLTSARDARIEQLREQLDRARTSADPLAVEHAAGTLATILAGDPEETVLRQLRDDSSPIALARNGALWLVAPDGGDGQILTNAVPVARPIWSPNRDRIAFVSTDPWGDEVPAILFVIDADGSNLRPLYQMAHPNAIPSWSPDGSRIALTTVEYWSLTRETGHLTIHIIPLDGGPLVDIATGFDGHATTPAWSPDGRSIAFIGRPLDDPDSLAPLSGPTSVMLWSDDSPLHSLSGDRMPRAIRLFWNRDGRSLAVLNRNPDPVVESSGDSTNLSAIDVRTGEISTIDPEIPAAAAGWTPVAAPTGGRIAWVAGARTVVIWSPDGSEQAIDTGRLLSGALSWAPGGGALLAVAAEPAQPSAIIEGNDGFSIVDVPLQYDLEWPTGVPQWSPVLNPPLEHDGAGAGVGLDA